MRVGGEDLFPPESPKSHPTAAIVREALARRLSEGQPANPQS